MRLYRAVALLAMVGMTMAGCAGPGDRSAALGQLSPEPMSERAWAHTTGTYFGPVRSATQRFGYEGVSSMELRLDLSGPATAPGVNMRIDNGFATAWRPYAERKGTFTNLPEKRYGSQGWVEASTHAPNQLLLHFRRFGGALSPNAAWMILTFRGDGNVDIDFLGHNGYRGDGALTRAPSLSGLH